MKISEQKKYLDENWMVVPLRGRNREEAKQNAELIKNFVHKNTTLDEYLKYHAWKEDESGSKKVYLILGQRKKLFQQKWDIVGYFALCTGLLYIPKVEEEKLEPHEELFLEMYTKARMTSRAYASYLTLQAANVYSPKRLEELQHIWNMRYPDYVDRVLTRQETTQQVSQVLPGIEITHLCRNEAFPIPDEIDIGFAGYIFWERIVPIILDVSQKVGVSYLYLFAAEKHPKNPNQDVIDAALKEEAAGNHGGRFISGKSNNRLITLYTRDLKFRLIDEQFLLKPRYDYNCFSMIQKVADLPKNRNQFWEEHADEPEEW